MFDFIVITIICIFLFTSAYQILVKDNLKFAEIPDICLKKLSKRERAYLQKSIGISYILIGVLIWLLMIIKSSILIKIIIISMGIIAINIIRIIIKFIYLK